LHLVPEIVSRGRVVVIVSSIDRLSIVPAEHGGRGYRTTKDAGLFYLYSLIADRSSLELRVEHLRNVDVSSILRPATTIDTMLINLQPPRFPVEATSAASILPCWHSFDPNRRPGYALALAGSYAR
jgi:hypothetical protein